MRLFRACGLLFWLLCAIAQAQDLNASIELERGILAKLKTAYLFNMVKFVTWPEQDQDVFLCLRSNSPVMRFAEQLDGRALGDGRKIRIRPISDAGTVCSMVYDDLPSEDRAKAGVTWDAGSVLTISDKPNAIADGFAIRLFFESKKLQFAVNPEQVQQADYRISSKLMRLARSSGSNSS